MSQIEYNFTQIDAQSIRKKNETVEQVERLEAKEPFVNPVSYYSLENSPTIHFWKTTPKNELRIEEHTKRGKS